MEKSLRCRDVGVDCDFVACGRNEDEIFQKAGEHARLEHNKTEFSKEEINKARSFIREGC